MKQPTKKKETKPSNVVSLIQRPKADLYYGYGSAEALIAAVIEYNPHPPTIDFMRGKTLHLVDIAPPDFSPESTYGIGVEVFGWREQIVVNVYGVVPPYIPEAGLQIFEVGLRVLN